MSFKSLLKQSVSYFWGEAAVMAAGIISFPILTRLLTKQQYGIMSLLTITATILTSVFSMGGNRSILRFYHVYKKTGERTVFVGSLFYAMLFSQLLGVSACLVAAWLLLMHGFISQTVFYLLPIALGVLITNNFFLYLNTIYRMEEAVFQYVSLSVIRQYGAMAVSIYLVFLYGNLFVFFGSQLIVHLLLISFVLVLLYRKIGLLIHKVSMPMIKESVKYGVPLSLSAIFTMIMNSGDRYVIAYLLGTEDVAIYSVGFKLCHYFKEFMITSINMSLIPLVYKLWEQSQAQEAKDTLRSVVKYYFMAGTAVLCLYTIIPTELISILASKKYSDASGVLPVLMLGVIINFDFPFAAGLYLSKKTFSILIAMAATAAINIALNFLLIPMIGILGAAYATAFCSFFLIILLRILSRKTMSYPLPYKEMGKYIILGGLSFWVTSYLTNGILLNQLLLRCILISTLFLAAYGTLILLSDTHLRNSLFGSRISALLGGKSA